MFDTSKGITPVIAIVLLLLVTVGAVGVVYTQFQSLVGDGPDTSFLDAQSVNLEYRTMTRDSSTGTDYMQANLVNNDDRDFTFDNSTGGTLVELQYQIPGEERLQPGTFDQVDGFSYSSGDNSCEDLGTISPGDEPDCVTGVTMPESGSEVDVHLVLAETDSVVTTYTCEPSTSSSTTC